MTAPAGIEAAVREKYFANDLYMPSKNASLYPKQLTLSKKGIHDCKHRIRPRDELRSPLPKEEIGSRQRLPFADEVHGLPYQAGRSRDVSSTDHPVRKRMRRFESPGRTLCSPGLFSYRNDQTYR